LHQGDRAGQRRANTAETDAAADPGRPHRVAQQAECSAGPCAPSRCRPAAGCRLRVQAALTMSQAALTMCQPSPLCVSANSRGARCRARQRVAVACEDQSPRRSRAGVDDRRHDVDVNWTGSAVAPRFDPRPTGRSYPCPGSGHFREERPACGHRQADRASNPPRSFARARGMAPAPPADHACRPPRPRHSDRNAWLCPPPS
jgi:hypothetical protein